MGLVSASYLWINFIYISFRIWIFFISLKKVWFSQINIRIFIKKDAADRNDLLYKNPCTSHAPVQIFGVFILIFMYFLKSSYLHERITKHVHIDVFYHNQKEKCKGFTLNTSFLKKRKRLTPFPHIFLKKIKPPPPKKDKKPPKTNKKTFSSRWLYHMLHGIVLFLTFFSQFFVGCSIVWTK